MKLLAMLIFGAFALYLIQKKTPQMIGWMIVTYLVAYHGLFLDAVSSSLLAVGSVFVVARMTYNAWEGFDNDEEKEDKKKESPDPAPAKTDAPHVDLGTTILHAYRNLSPEQIGGMRRDTKELMELQKELMSTLGEMKPAIEQGAQLLGTFSQFFGQGE